MSLDPFPLYQHLSINFHSIAHHNWPLSYFKMASRVIFTLIRIIFKYGRGIITLSASRIGGYGHNTDFSHRLLLTSLTLRKHTRGVAATPRISQFALHPCTTDTIWALIVSYHRWCSFYYHQCN